jgi:hypothetical protein
MRIRLRYIASYYPHTLFVDASRVIPSKPIIRVGGLYAV